jgi:hypothetical protein
VENQVPTQQAAANSPALSPATLVLQEHAKVLLSVPEYLAKGLDLKRWWDEVERRGGPERRFPLERSFNRPTRSYGFFGEAPVGGIMMPVMGNVQEMFYDQAREFATAGRSAAEWNAAQMREFALKYFMRISSFRPPEIYVEASQPRLPQPLEWLSWCPVAPSNQVGFGFKQLFYGRLGSSAPQAFPNFEQAAIVDQRQVGRLFDWLLLKVRIFDFAFRWRPLGAAGPDLTFALNEESYLVVHRQFINDKDSPLPGVLGDFGIGYSFVKNPTRGPFGYGPGEFDAALELINFRVYENGYISVRMVFISNRPKTITHVEVNPVRWGFFLADFFSLGLVSRWLRPAREVLERFPLQFTVDPVRAYVSATGLLTGGYANHALCVSLEQLEKAFLLQHFKQHYETILGSLATWRRFPDWLDEKSLPDWVTSGVG